MNWKLILRSVVFFWLATPGIVAVIDLWGVIIFNREFSPIDWHAGKATGAWILFWLGVAWWSFTKPKWKNS